MVAECKKTLKHGNVIINNNNNIKQQNCFFLCSIEVMGFNFGSQSSTLLLKLKEDTTTSG